MKVFTTGQVAKICKVAPRTVSKWCDSGRLRCYRLPVGSHDRRIPREYLIQFLKEYRMPFGDLGDEETTLRVLLVFADTQLLMAVKASFLRIEAVEVLSATGIFAAEMCLQENRLDAVVIDLGIGHAEASELCKRLHETEHCLHAIAIGLYDGHKDVRSSRFADLIRKPFNPPYLVERVKTLVTRARAY